MQEYQEQISDSPPQNPQSLSPQSRGSNTPNKEEAKGSQAINLQNQNNSPPSNALG